MAEDWLPGTPAGEPTMFTSLTLGELESLWDKLRGAHDKLVTLPQEQRQPTYSEVVPVWWDVATEIDRRNGGY